MLNYLDSMWSKGKTNLEKVRFIYYANENRGLVNQYTIKLYK